MQTSLITPRVEPTNLLSLSLAMVSIGAAAIHFAVIPEHLAEWWAFGVFFAALGWFQALWAVAYVARPSARLAWLAICVNLATVALWAWTRTMGLPFGPEPGVPEPVGAPDIVSSALELVLAAGLLVTRRRSSPTSGAQVLPWPAVLFVAALVAIVTTISLAEVG